MYVFFFFNDTATTEIYTLSLHDALPICGAQTGLRQHALDLGEHAREQAPVHGPGRVADDRDVGHRRSEEHTSELQSRQYLVCRLLLEKKKIPISIFYLHNHTHIYTTLHS